MKKKHTSLAMIGLVLAANVGCTTILDIDHQYYDCSPKLYCGGNECVDGSTDSKNCGRCGHDCQGGACLNGQCQAVPLASGHSYPTYIVVDAKNIYWTNRGSPPLFQDGSVMKMAIDGGSAEEIAPPQKTPRCITVDATHVYWTNVGDKYTDTKVVLNPGTVMRVAIDGTNLTPLASGQNNPYDIVVTDEFIFWTNEGTPPPPPPIPPELPSPPPTDGSIMRLERPKMDPAPMPVPMPLVSGLTYPQGIAVYEKNVYWTEANGLWRIPFEGGEKKHIHSVKPMNNQFWSSRLRIHGTNLYWTNTDAGVVMKVRITGNDTYDVDPLSSSTYPFDIAVDGTHVYWTNPQNAPKIPNSDGSVYKFGHTNRATSVLASAQGAPLGIAVDATTIYWTNAFDGTVMKLAK